MSWVSSALGSDAAQTAQAKANAPGKVVAGMYSQYGVPSINRNVAIQQGMVPWLQELARPSGQAVGQASAGGVPTWGGPSAVSPPPAVAQFASQHPGKIVYDQATGGWKYRVAGDPLSTSWKYDWKTGTMKKIVYKNPASWGGAEYEQAWSPETGAGLNLGTLPAFMNIDVNQPFTPQELASRQSLTDIGLSGYRGRLADQLATTMAQRGLSGSSAAITGTMGVEDAYERARTEEQAKLSEALYAARQSARTEAAKNFYSVLAQIQAPTGAEDWSRILTGQGDQLQGQANQAQGGYVSNVNALEQTLAAIFA